MTLEEVRKRVDLIREAVRQGKHDVAHGLEDDLYRDVLLAVIDMTCGDAAELTAAALKAGEIQFPRYCT